MRRMRRGTAETGGSQVIVSGSNATSKYVEPVQENAQPNCKVGAQLEFESCTFVPNRVTGTVSRKENPRRQFVILRLSTQ